MSGPESQHLLSAAAQLERIATLAHRMSVSNRQQRQFLFQLAKAPIHHLLTHDPPLCSEPALLKARVADVASGLLQLRNRPLSEPETQQGESVHCTLCDDTLQENYLPAVDSSQEPRVIVYCPTCCQPVTQALQSLSQVLFPH